MASPTRDFGLLKWIFQTYVLGTVVILLPATALIAIVGNVLKSNYTIPGWAVLSASLLFGLLILSASYNVRQWWRHCKPRPAPNLSIVTHGSDQARFWEQPQKTTQMTVSGLYDITNISQFDITIPRSFLEVRSWWLGILPVYHRIEGDGPDMEEPAAHMHRMHWYVDRLLVKRGRSFRGRVILVDSLGVYNYSEWATWRSIN